MSSPAAVVVVQYAGKTRALLAGSGIGPRGGGSLAPERDASNFSMARPLIGGTFVNSPTYYAVWVKEPSG